MNNEQTKEERIKGQAKRLLAGETIRFYDYKTILVPGELHYAIKQQALNEGISIRKLIQTMFNTTYPMNSVKEDLDNVNE
jgi:LDH2 family malate/lactate/ureidoglycolate dehydrogenase